MLLNNCLALNTNNRDREGLLEVCLTILKMSGSNFKIRVFITLDDLGVRPLV